MKFSLNRLKEEKLLMYAVIMSIVTALLITITGMVLFQSKAKESGLFTRNMDNKVYAYHYVLLVDDVNDPFWQAVYEGAKEKGRENNIYVELIGKDLPEASTVNELMEIAIASKVDGIIVSPVDSRTTQLINQAADQEIDVVTIYNDSIKGKRRSFVGVGSYNLGQEYGKLILKIKNEDTENVTVLVDSNNEISNQNLICSSIREKLAGTNIKVTAEVIDKNNAFSAEETIRNIMIKKHNKPDILVCLSSVNTQCAYQSVVDYNMVGQVQILGYYESDLLLEAISKNVIQGAITVDATQMGEKAVEVLYEYQKMDRVNEFIPIDIKEIDENNVKEYMDPQNSKDKTIKEAGN